MLLGVLWASALLAQPSPTEGRDLDTDKSVSDFPTINSTTALSLDSLIALGFENNPSLRQTEFDTRLNRIGMLNAIGNFLPTVSVGMSFSESHYENRTFVNPDGSVSTYPVTESFTEQYIIWDTTGNQLSNPRLSEPVTITQITDVPEGSSRSSRMYLSLNESIFEGGRRYFLYRKATTQKKINNLSVIDAQKTLAAQIVQQVVLVQTQQELLELNRKLRDQRKDLFDLAKARFEVGAVTELDVLQAQIELNTAENSITTSERNLQASREALNQLLGIDLRSSFPLPETEGVTPFEFDLDQLVAEAYANRTDLQIAGLTVNRTKHNVNVYRSEYLPRVNFGAQWDRSEVSGTSEYWTLNPRNNDATYSLSLSWTLFDGFSREYNIATQKVQYLRAVESERALRLSTERAVRDAFYNLEKVFKELQITEQNRDLADRQLNLERERYRLGATSQLSLRDAQFVYAEAETNHLQKTLEYQSTLIALELAVGRQIR